MELSSLERLLDRTPVVIKEINPVSLAYLGEGVEVCYSLEQLVFQLDDPSPTEPHPIVCLDADPRYLARFPAVSVEHNPFTPDLNRLLFRRYDCIAASMLTHAQVADRIVEAAREAETVALVLLDGLSYADCSGWPGVEACLASAPTLTRVGLPAVVNDPPIAARLFSLGFTQRVGFTYWDRGADALTDRLFRTIGDTRRLDPADPMALGQIVDWLGRHELRGTYLQIVWSALDEYAKGHRAPSPRQVIVNRIRSDLELLREALGRKSRRALLFAVADHGFLWKDGGHPLEIVGMGGARCVEGHGGPGRGRRVEADGRSYWVLDYPQLGRPWRANEQGVHGGISFEESIVPFLKWEVNW